MKHSSLVIFILILSSAQVCLGEDGFDFPLGPPDGIGYSENTIYGGLGYLESYKYGCGWVFHPANDINDDDSGDDYGGDAQDAFDPVWAVADGTVTYADCASDGWGNIVLIEHEGEVDLPDGGS